MDAVLAEFEAEELGFDAVPRATAEEDALAEAVVFFAPAAAEAEGAAEALEEPEVVPEGPASAFRRSYSSLVMVLPSASVYTVSASAAPSAEPLEEPFEPPLDESLDSLEP